MTTMQTTDPVTLVAWVTAPRHEELDRYRDWYAARYPAPAVTPPADCSIHHNAFGPGCPYCSPRTRSQESAR